MRKLFLLAVLLAAVGIAMFWIVKPGNAPPAATTTQQDAAELPLPSEIVEVGWLASKSEVKAKRPNVVERDPELLSAPTSLYGRPAVIAYSFGIGTLYFSYTFTDASTETTFAATQARLVQDYGAIAEATRSLSEYAWKLCAKKRVKRFSMEHCRNWYWFSPMTGQAGEHVTFFPERD